ncbi:hypothetical protein GKG03_08435 [Finegoldia sp. BIOML-A3]|uniref:CD0519/CD1768 family membrane protein n=1 Tax=unclassified Finegoldia TaxID=2619637 RepID=UPI0012B047BE|nr:MULTISPECIES: hypothetical protein [unclassified Finegoldia]MSA99691.1 hypothetical protein [Finegoldia sp. BIOML-A3]MSB93677.1 hypothetical protein [Finegoldia sp. BIOML-A4]
MEKSKKQSEISLESFVTIAVVFGLFGYIAKVMGLGNMFNTLMKTAHDLLLNTVFFIMAIAVLTGALSKLLSEFGVIALINKIISPIMKPLYNLPGASALGILTTFLSDNPAIIGLAKDKGFAKYFKNYQLPTLCNLGTSFGMGFIVWTFMSSLGNGTEFFKAASLGVLGAVVGSVVSVRIMMHFTKKFYADTDEQVEFEEEQIVEEKEDSTLMERILNSMLEGGKSGVQAGMDIIPGVVVICTLVMILTSTGTVENGTVVYTGAAYEGVGLIPKLGALLNPILKSLFGFTSSECIAFPLTALGSVGAALGLVPKLLEKNLITGNDIAVFTALGMCWSGYLSTHVGMMDTLNARKLAPKAILSHTIGGVAAGISAHFLYLLLG